MAPFENHEDALILTPPIALANIEFDLDVLPQSRGRNSDRVTHTKDLIRRELGRSREAETGTFGPLHIGPHSWRWRDRRWDDDLPKAIIERPVSAVPEPATVLLLASGLAALAVLRRRRE